MCVQTDVERHDVRHTLDVTIRHTLYVWTHTCDNVSIQTQCVYTDTHCISDCMSVHTLQCARVDTELDTRCMCVQTQCMSVHTYTDIQCVYRHRHIRNTIDCMSVHPLHVHMQRVYRHTLRGTIIHTHTLTHIHTHTHTHTHAHTHIS